MKALPKQRATELLFRDLTPRQMRAIQNFLNKGFVIRLSRLPNIEFVSKDTREVEVRTLDELLNDYDSDRRDEARARTAQKRIMKRNQARATGRMS